MMHIVAPLKLQQNGRLQTIEMGELAVTAAYCITYSTFVELIRSCSAFEDNPVDILTCRQLVDSKPDQTVQSYANHIGRRIDINQLSSLSVKRSICIHGNQCLG